MKPINLKPVTTTILGLILFAGMSALAPFAHAVDYIIICSGQSNMAGVANSKDMPDELRTVPANILYYHCNATVKDREVDKMEPTKSFDDGPMDGPVPRMYGPIPRFAHLIAAARPNDRFIILLNAQGGTGLATWVPDYTPKEIAAKLPIGKFYNIMVPRIAALRKKYLNAKPLAFLWLQGEHERFNADWTAAYGDNLKRLTANMRRDTGNPELLTLIAEPGLTSEGVFDAIGKFTQEDKHSALIKTRDFNNGGKNLHFNAQGYDEIGKRYAAALLSRMPENSATSKPAETQKAQP